MGMKIATAHSGPTKGEHNTQHMRKHIETLARYSGVSPQSQVPQRMTQLPFLRKRLDNLPSYRVGVSDNRIYIDLTISPLCHTHCILHMGGTTLQAEYGTRDQGSLYT